MKKIIFFLIVILACGTIQAQSGSLSKKEQRQLLKEEKRRVAAEEAAHRFMLMEEMIKSAGFVLEADMLYDKYGKSYQVQSSINFLLADSLAGIIQIGNSYQIGQNGVGGITIEGNISNYSIEKNEKRNSYLVTYNLHSTYGTYRVSLNAFGSGRCDATVSGNFSGSIRYSGKLVPLRKSRIYKGTSY